MKILIVAGETSGDLHGSFIAKAILEKNSSVKLYGLGGRRMEEAGVQLIFTIEKTAVVGLIELLGKISFFVRLYTLLLSRIKKDRYDALILIDYPTLNLSLARHAKKIGIPVFYFISPQIWAWRKKRIISIKRDVSRMMVILPFEKEFYSENGMEVDFVGHPFVDIVSPSMTKESAKEKFGISPKKNVIGLFPGSRKNEIRALLPVICKSVSLIRKDMPDAQFILSLSDAILREQIEGYLDKQDNNIKIAEGSNYDVMNISDFLIVASGSVSLEISFFEVPMVIIYKTNPITFMLAKRFVNVKHIGLVNIVGGEAIVPELIQNDATPENIKEEVFSILRDKSKYNYIQKRLRDVRESLGTNGACKRAADIILTQLNI